MGPGRRPSRPPRAHRPSRGAPPTDARPRRAFTPPIRRAERRQNIARCQSWPALPEGLPPGEDPFVASSLTSSSSFTGVQVENSRPLRQASGLTRSPPGGGREVSLPVVHAHQLEIALLVEGDGIVRPPAGVDTARVDVEFQTRVRIDAVLQVGDASRSHRRAARSSSLDSADRHPARSRGTPSRNHRP